MLADRCDVDNGGCDVNAICSHDDTTYAVVCHCKSGYVNIGTGSIVACSRMLFSFN